MMLRLGLLAFVILLPSCRGMRSAAPRPDNGSVATDSVKPDTSGVAGAWEWVESRGGKTGRQRTPATEGYSLRFDFQADSTFSLRLEPSSADNRPPDGHLQMATGRYVVDSTGTGLRVVYGLDGMTAPMGVVSFSRAGSPPVHEVRLGGRELILDEGCCDRFVHTFRRIQ